MSSHSDDESLIHELAKAFSVAVARGVPREIAALMCADEAEPFWVRLHPGTAVDAWFSVVLGVLIDM
jgi:hypothetical protein